MVLAPNAKLRALVVPQEPEPPAQAAQPAECEAKCAHQRPVRLSWAKLLKRVFDLDVRVRLGQFCEQWQVREDHFNHRLRWVCGSEVSSQ